MVFLSPGKAAAPTNKELLPVICVCLPAIPNRSKTTQNDTLPEPIMELTAEVAVVVVHFLGRVRFRILLLACICICIPNDDDDDSKSAAASIRLVSLMVV
jgi:hypothetical protein